VLLATACAVREGEALSRDGEDGPCGWWARAWAEGAPVELNLRWCCCGDRLLLEVLCDQRLMFSEPSRKAPMPSAAPLAALERRREAVGGGGGGCRAVEDSAGASLADSEAALFTVTTDDDEMEVLRDRLWRCEGWAAAGSCMLLLLVLGEGLGVSQNRAALTSMQRADGKHTCRCCRNALDGLVVCCRAIVHRTHRTTRTR